jgi:hypothetical protein
MATTHINNYHSHQYCNNRSNNNVSMVRNNNNNNNMVSLCKCIIVQLMLFHLWMNIESVHFIVVDAQQVPSQNVSFTPIRINSGSTSSVVTTNNITWNPDQYALSGGLYNTCTNTTTSTNIYCTSRFFKQTRGKTYRYNIPVPFNNIYYQLRLHFAEQVRLHFYIVCFVVVKVQPSDFERM